jgi:ComF family protein
LFFAKNAKNRRFFRSKFAFKSTDMKQIQQYGIALLHLFFPKLCIACNTFQPIKDNALCGACEMALPLADNLSPYLNSFHRRLAGRLPLHWAMAYLHYKPANAAQKILHDLKYNGNQEIGTALGKRLGLEIIKNIEANALPDVIIPVPLHPKKLHQRGYNQSLSIALGLSQILQRPVKDKDLIRIKNTETQTKKSRLERLENVSGAFTLLHPSHYKNKRILLVDDVFTSGATTEACAGILYESGIASLSMATLALAEDW